MRTLMGRLWWCGLLVAGVMAVVPGSRAADTGTMQSKLDSIIFLKFEVEDVSVSTVLELIKVRAREMDFGLEKLNLVVKAAPETLEKPMTISLDRVPLGDLLRYVCMSGDLKYKVEEHAIIVFDRTAKGILPMQTRVFRINPTSLTLKESQKKGKGIGDDDE